MESDNGVSRFRRDLWKRAASTSIALVSLAILAAPASAYDVSAEVKLYDRSGHQVGKVRLTEQGDGNVAVNVRVRDLTQGFHGFHVHAVGNCTIEDPLTPTPFTSAGGHFRLSDKDHGEHAGDFPVLLVRSDGTANVNFRTDRFTLNDLFNGDGTAIIIHQGRDNYANIPDRYTGPSGPDRATLDTGDSGARFACGVVEKVVRRDKGDREDDDRHDR